MSFSLNSPPSALPGTPPDTGHQITVGNDHPDVFRSPTGWYWHLPASRFVKRFGAAASWFLVCRMMVSCLECTGGILGRVAPRRISKSAPAEMVAYADPRRREVITGAWGGVILLIAESSTGSLFALFSRASVSKQDDRPAPLFSALWSCAAKLVKGTG